jgi:hypothetical protein
LVVRRRQWAAGTRRAARASGRLASIQSASCGAGFRWRATRSWSRRWPTVQIAALCRPALSSLRSPRAGPIPRLQKECCTSKPNRSLKKVAVPVILLLGRITNGVSEGCHDLESRPNGHGFISAH